MKSFKHFYNEIVDNLEVPKYRNRKVIVNKGTNTAREIREYKWNTRLGNEVKLQYFPKDGGPDNTSYDIRFYVNDTLFDNASQKEGSARDPEILLAIFGILAKNPIKATTITFTAFDSENDVKVIRNMPIEKPKEMVLKEIGSLENIIKMHIEKMVNPSKERIDLFTKLGRPVPGPSLDFDKNKWLGWINSLRQSIMQNSLLDDYIDKIYVSAKELSVINYNNENLIELMKQFNYAAKSMTESGWLRRRNRRESVYEKLIKKHLPNWNMTKNGNYFKLDLVK